MTILISFHVIGFRNFKAYYIHLQEFHINEFGKLPSYNRFIELIQRTLVPMFFLHKACLKQKQVVTLWIPQQSKFVALKDRIRTRFLNRFRLKVKLALAGFLDSNYI
jgi:hypothetical protein